MPEYIPHPSHLSLPIPSVIDCWAAASPEWPRTPTKSDCTSCVFMSYSSSLLVSLPPPAANSVRIALATEYHPMIRTQRYRHILVGHGKKANFSDSKSYEMILTHNSLSPSSSSSPSIPSSIILINDYFFYLFTTFLVTECNRMTMMNSLSRLSPSSSSLVVIDDNRSTLR